MPVRVRRYAYQTVKPGSARDRKIERKLAEVREFLTDTARVEKDQAIEAELDVDHALADLEAAVEKADRENREAIRAQDLKWKLDEELKEMKIRQPIHPVKKVVRRKR